MFARWSYASCDRAIVVINEIAFDQLELDWVFNNCERIQSVIIVVIIIF
jgi:hypothetical protein